MAKTVEQSPRGVGSDVGDRPEVRTKIWFEADGRRVFGTGIAGLIENIDRLGTLTAAARAANMSYRYAWQLLRTAETYFSRALVTRRTGGRTGGGMALTADGRRALKVFRALDQDVADFADERFRKLYAQDAD